MLVVYMTMGSEIAVRKNRAKYDVLRKVVRQHAGEKVTVMGDMNGHRGVFGEKMYQNRELLDEFVHEINLENLHVTLAEGRVMWTAREFLLSVRKIG